MGGKHSKVEEGAVFKGYESDLISSIFAEMAARSPGKTIDKVTFLKLFDLPGHLGERLFAVFDSKKTGVIDEEEFFQGLAVYIHGTLDMKIRMLFDMYDMAEDGSVSRIELKTMLHSLVTPPQSVLGQLQGGQSLMRQESTQEAREEYAELKTKEVEKIVQEAFDTCDISRDGRLHFNEFHMFVANTPSVLQALEREFVVNHWIDPRYDDPETKEVEDKRAFDLAMNELPEIHCGHCGFRVAYCASCGEHVLPPTEKAVPESPVRQTSGSGLFERSASMDLGSRMASFVAPTAAGGGYEAKCGSCTESTIYKKCPVCSRGIKFGSAFVGNSGVPGTPRRNPSSSSNVFARKNSNNAGAFLNISNRGDSKRNVGYTHQGTLYKKGSMLKMWASHYSEIRGSFLYLFQDSKGLKPSGVMFIEGCAIEPVNESSHKYFGFEIFPFDSKLPSKTFFTKSEEERQEWIANLRQAGKATPIEELYHLGRHLGKGRFSVVKEGTHIVSGKKVAIKVIDKIEIKKPSEKEAMRTEIAIMKLVKHPHVLRLHDTFEARNKIYLVMQFCAAGDLFDRIILRKRMSERVTKRLVWNLLNSVKYLHDRGIVHRDLKPENILCADTEDDANIIIADFGLSKFFSPEEVMKVPCGTITYCAPEVLLRKGYGKEVDLWSIGIITFLLFRGGLPFEGRNKQETIDKILHRDLNFNTPTWMSKIKITDEAIDFIKRLLKKQPANRLSMERALAHKWFDDVRSDNVAAHKIDEIDRKSVV